MKLNTKYTKPPDDHHSSDVVCWRRGDTQSWINLLWLWWLMMITNINKLQWHYQWLGGWWSSICTKKTSSALDRRWSV